MAKLTPVQRKITGASAPMTAAASGGDTFEPGPHTFVVRNAHASAPRTVTIAVPGKTKYGIDNPDIAVVVAANGGQQAIGPFPADLADPADGLVHVTYSDSAADLTRALIRS